MNSSDTDPTTRVSNTNSQSKTTWPKDLLEFMDDKLHLYETRTTRHNNDTYKMEMELETNSGALTPREEVFN